MKIKINRICLAAMMLFHLAEATSAEVPPIEREHLADFLFDLQAHWKFEDSTTVELLDFTVLDNLVVLRSEVFEHSGEHLGLVCVRARFNKSLGSFQNQAAFISKAILWLPQNMKKSSSSSIPDLPVS